MRNDQRPPWDTPTGQAPLFSSSASAFSSPSQTLSQPSSFSLFSNAPAFGSPSNFSSVQGSQGSTSAFSFSEHSNFCPAPSPFSGNSFPSQFPSSNTSSAVPFSPVSLIPSPRFTFVPSSFTPSSSPSPSPTASPSASQSPSPLHFSSQPAAFSSPNSSFSSFSPFGSYVSQSTNTNSSGPNSAGFPFAFTPPTLPPNIPSLMISPRSCSVSPCSLVSLSPHPSPHSSLSHSLSTLLSIHSPSTSSSACPSPPPASLTSSPTNSPTTSRPSSPTASPSSSIIRGKETKRGRPRQMTCVFCYLRHSTCHQSNCVSYATFGRWTDEQYKKYLPIWIQWGPRLFYPKGVKRVKANQIRDTSLFRRRIEEALEELDIIRRGVKEDQSEDAANRVQPDDKLKGQEMDCEGEGEDWAGVRDWEVGGGSGIRREWAGGSGIRRNESGSGIGFGFGFGSDGGSGIARGGSGILRDETIRPNVRGGGSAILRTDSNGSGMRGTANVARRDGVMEGIESAGMNPARERVKGGSGIKREGREVVEQKEDVSNKKLHVSYLLHG